jgi:GTP cyclohydrolase IA
VFTAQTASLVEGARDADGRTDSLQERSISSHASSHSVGVDLPRAGIEARVPFTISSSDQAEAALAGVLVHIGFDLDSDGRAETPGRMLRALRELTSGYAVDTQALLERTFAETYDDLVIVSGIPFASVCAHHVLPFTGVITVGYLPAGAVVGLSKIPRLVSALAARFQVQEAMTRQVVCELDTALTPGMVGAVVTGRHSCMACRGVRSEGAMHTHSFLRATSDQRSEILETHRRHLAWNV